MRALTANTPFVAITSSRATSSQPHWLWGYSIPDNPHVSTALAREIIQISKFTAPHQSKKHGRKYIVHGRKIRPYVTIIALLNLQRVPCSKSSSSSIFSHGNAPALLVSRNPNAKPLLSLLGASWPRTPCVLGSHVYGCLILFPFVRNTFPSMPFLRMRSCLDSLLYKVFLISSL